MIQPKKVLLHECSRTFQTVKKLHFKRELSLRGA